VPSGVVLRPPELGVAASIGKREIQVRRYPRVAILSTGDELVDIDQELAAHQIRKSNVYALHGLVNNLGCTAGIFHVNDDENALRSGIAALLGQNDVVLISGGVSKGKFDFIPQVLRELGVNEHFHRIKQKPGKPLWFGTSEHATVFGFPGNPVSTLVCAYRYFLPWWYASLGTPPKKEFVVMGEDVVYKPGLTQFTSVSIAFDVVYGRCAYAVRGGGSGDFAHLANADGFVELDDAGGHIKKGTVVPFYAYLGPRP
jgi:molybdopterin molybdotransferase